MIKMSKKYQNNEPTNIYESLKPFYYTLKLFGLAPFHINFINGQLKTTFIDYLTFIVFNCFYLFMVYSIYSVATDTYSPEGRSILIVGYEFVYAYQFLLTFGTFIYNFYTRQKVGTFLRMIAKFDETIEIMNWNFKINHLKNYWNLFFWIGISTSSILFIYVLQVFYVTPSSEVSDFIYMLCFTFITKANTLIIFQFIFSSYCVQSRFDILNQNAK